MKSNIMVYPAVSGGGEAAPAPVIQIIQAADPIMQTVHVSEGQHVVVQDCDSVLLLSDGPLAEISLTLPVNAVDGKRLTVTSLKNIMNLKIGETSTSLMAVSSLNFIFSKTAGWVRV